MTLATHEWTTGRPDPGAGAPIAVLVHGVTGWHRTWWRVGPALAAHGWRVIAVDQRGHGRSRRIQGHTNVSEMAADLAAAIDAIGAPVDAVIGHSLGAAVGAELAHLRPDVVGRLVLEDPPAVTRADDLTWQANLEREMLAAHADFSGEVTRELAANPAWQAEDARQDIEGKQLADREGLMATFRRETGARVPELVARLTIPTLYLLAAEDRSVYLGAARGRLVADLPEHSRVVVLDAGHTIHRDAFEDYMDAVLGWIQAPAR